MKIAAIDIGSNAARLLINEARENQHTTNFIKINLLRIPLRLGMDVFGSGKIGAEREKMFLKTMRVFRDVMDLYEVKHYRACSTSAMRNASNGQQLVSLIKEKANIDLEIISEDQEAALIYENHIAESLNKDNDYLYIDVGGGSTEIVFYKNAQLTSKKSFKIGTIRLLQNLTTDQDWEIMRTYIQKNIHSEKNIVAIGSGGNINKIFSLSKTKDGKPLEAKDLCNYHKILNVLSVKERMVQYNLKEDRADVIVPALEIFNNILNWSKIQQIHVPKISVADGIIRSVYKNLKKPS